jgi:hypothetical protein
MSVNLVVTMADPITCGIGHFTNKPVLIIGATDTRCSAGCVWCSTKDIIASSDCAKAQGYKVVDSKELYKLIGKLSPAEVVIGFSVGEMFGKNSRETAQLGVKILSDVRLKGFHTYVSTTGYCTNSINWENFSNQITFLNLNMILPPALWLHLPSSVGHNYASSYFACEDSMRSMRERIERLSESTLRRAVFYNVTIPVVDELWGHLSVEKSNRSEGTYTVSIKEQVACVIEHVIDLTGRGGGKFGGNSITMKKIDTTNSELTSSDSLVETLYSELYKEMSHRHGRTELVLFKDTSMRSV